MKKLFLTGATGVLGSAVLKKLLLNTDAEIFVLIRGKNPDERLLQVLSFLNLYAADYKHRCKIINSTAEINRYNLNEKDFTEFALSLSNVFHCAANVDLLQDASEAAEKELSSIENILKILVINRHCKLEHVSTVGVKGRLSSGLKEEPFSDTPGFFNSYEFAKYQVEQKIYPFMEQGFAITLHRPSMVVGEAETGKILNFQIFHFLLRLVCGDLTYGILPPVLQRKLDTIPSDFVADCIFESSQKSDFNGRIIHCCSGPEDSLSLLQISQIANQVKDKLSLPVKKIVTLPDWFFRGPASLAQVLPLSEKWKKRIELLPQLLDYAGQEQIFYNQQSKILFAHKKWPSPKDYLDNSIYYYFSKYKLRERK